MGGANDALSGAAGGAAMGSAFGPWGAAAGGLIGGIGGYFGAGSGQDYYQTQLKKLQAGYQGRQAPQMGPAAQAGPSGLMGNRASMIAQLEAQSRGEGPSAARLQMQQAADRSAQMLASNAAGAGGRGVNAGAAMRNAGNQSANVMQQNNQNMGIMRAQEQLNAMGQLGGAIGQGIGQDNQQAQWNAGAQNDQASLNTQMQMQMLGLNDRSQLQALQMGMGGAQPSLGQSLMAGGATAAPMLMQMMHQPQQQAGYGGAIGPQQGQPGWANSPMGQYQNAHVPQSGNWRTPQPWNPNYNGTPSGGNPNY
jgi:hypothetical protein